MRVVTINGNAAGGDPIIQGGSGGVTIKYDPVCCRFPGVEDTHWPYILDTDQWIKLWNENISDNDFLAVQLSYDAISGREVDGIGSFDDLKNWLASNRPCIRYGIGASGADVVPSNTYNNGKTQPEFQTNFQPSYRSVYGAQLCDSFSTTADEDSFGLYYNRNGAGDNYDTIVLKTASGRSRAQIIKGLQNICTIAPAAGASHIFIDDSYYGLWGSGTDGDTAAHYALPAQLAQYRDACHQFGLPAIHNIAMLRFENEALSYATGKSADAVLFEATFDGPLTNPNNVASATSANNLSLGVNLATHFKHVYALTSGGAMLAYVVTASGPDPMHGIDGQDYVSMTDFFTAVAMMVGRSLVLRREYEPIPASADWPIDLGARVGLPVFSGAGDIATCEFERGALQIDATNFTATKL
jgi:hypothetical protein